MSMSPVGQKNVVKMCYTIGVGTLEAGSPSIILANESSFKRGVSLSSISWGFYNSGSTDEKESSFISFTLHDIAGQTLKDFFEIRSGVNMIYFKGPMSDGSQWGGDWAIYHPVKENCTIEFSQTQGFTYKFSGVPSGRMVTSKSMSPNSKILINGLDVGNSKHGNTFGDYLREVEQKWNNMLEGDKAGTAKIKFEVGPGGVNGMMMAQTPYLTEKIKAGNTLKTSGDPVAQIQHYEIAPGTPIAKVVQDLWQTRFVPKEIAPGKDINAGSYLELTYKKYTGGMSLIDVKMQRKQETAVPGSLIPVCIGSDLVCAGQPYRAQLSGIEFKGILDIMTSAQINQTTAQATAEVAQQGNAGNVKFSAEKERILGGAGHMKETLAKRPMSPGLPMGNNGSFDGWHTFASILSQYRAPQFSIEIDMPYTYAFTPNQNGGLLVDAVPGASTGAIHVTQGVDLKFFWYATPKCDFMVPVPVISTTYRVSSVTHTIGLSGNSTQVKLSHLTVTSI